MARRFPGLQFLDDAFDKEGVGAAHKQCTNYAQVSDIFLDEWLDEARPMFDALDGGTSMMYINHTNKCHLNQSTAETA